jgi:hypothetical protein
VTIRPRIDKKVTGGTSEEGKRERAKKGANGYRKKSKVKSEANWTFQERRNRPWGGPVR